MADTLNLQVDRYFQELGLDRTLPVEKFVKNVDLDRWEVCKRLPQHTDKRGSELYSFLTVHYGETDLDIVFIGGAHIPYFHENLKQSMKPYIISAHHSSDPSPTTSLIYLSMLENYPMQVVEVGKPILLIGDSHYNKYETRFPDPAKLKDLGLHSVHFHAEFVPHKGTHEERLKRLNNPGFWGLHNLYQYMVRTQEAGLDTDLNGLEPTP